MKMLSRLFTCFAISLICINSVVANPLYKKKSNPVDLSVLDLLKRMTLDEKIAQLRHLHSTQVFDGQELDIAKLRDESLGLRWGFGEGFPLTSESCRKNYRQLQHHIMENTRLGIPIFIVGEALHGVVHEGATIFPQNVALGSTFNPELAYQKAVMISHELHHLGINQILAPCIDVVRELRWGRTEESYGEDPLLCGIMGLNEVNGYLDNNISPMLKHFGPHGNPRGGLNLASVDCGLSDLHEVYLKPFEMIVRNTPLRAIMSSYNSWNRIPNSASHYMLTELLRNQWGYEGFVYSDWGAIRMLKEFHFTAADDAEATLQAFKSGLDVEASSTCYPSLKHLVEIGKVSMSDIDKSVARVLKAKFEFGLFDNPFGVERDEFNSFHTHQAVDLAKKIADESIVLLKNNKKLLPLDINSLQSIAVIGPNADEVQLGDYTWGGDRSDGVTPLEGLQRICGEKIKINYAQGCQVASLCENGIDEAVKAAQKSDITILFLGNSSSKFVRESKNAPTSGEGYDLHDISLTGAQQKLVEAVNETGKPIIVVLVTGKPVAIPWIKDNIPSIVVQWYAGEQGGNSIAEMLFGKVNPSGKLPLSFPQSTGHLPVFYNYLPSDKGFYNEGGSYEKPGKDYVFSSSNALWSFGYGLSYTEFRFNTIKTDKTHYTTSDTIYIEVDVLNEGNCKGKEVVQAYVRDCFSSVVTPVKQLRAFQKVEINPGENKCVHLSIPIGELYRSEERRVGTEC